MIVYVWACHRKSEPYLITCFKAKLQQDDTVQRYNEVAGFLILSIQLLLETAAQLQACDIISELYPQHTGSKLNKPAVFLLKNNIFVLGVSIHL